MQAVRGLHLVTMPLTPLRFTGVAGIAMLLAAGYCLAHGLVANDQINLQRTLAWAVTSTLPWVCAWEGLKRLKVRPEQPPRRLLAAIFLIAALVVSVALAHALSSVYSVDTDSLGQIVYRLLPIPVSIAVASRLLKPVQISADVESPSERLLGLQLEQVLDIPTRSGMLAVRASDIEYVKAAGNYVELVTGERTLLMRATLQDLGGQLSRIGFVRVHRSLLVNGLHLLATRRGPRGRLIVKLRSGTELPVGRRFSGDIGPRSSQRERHSSQRG